MSNELKTSKINGVVIIELSPYFILHNFNEVDIVRIGGMEVYQGDQNKPEWNKVLMLRGYITDIQKEKNKKVVYMSLS